MFCQEVAAKTTDYLEDALPESERREWESHAAACLDCSRYIAQICITIRLTAGISSSSPEEVWPAIRH